MERHLLGGKGALIFRVKTACSHKQCLVACVARDNSTEPANPDCVKTRVKTIFLNDY